MYDTIIATRLLGSFTVISGAPLGAPVFFSAADGALHGPVGPRWFALARLPQNIQPITKRRQSATLGQATAVPKHANGDAIHHRRKTPSHERRVRASCHVAFRVRAVYEFGELLVPGGVAGAENAGDIRGGGASLHDPPVRS